MMENTALKACETLIREHRQTEELLDRLEESLYQICHQECSQALKDAKGLLHQLSLEMNTHFACEEEGLFPVLSKYHPMVLMEVEHDEILTIRAHLASALESYAFPENCTESLYKIGLRFIEELKNHIAREDSGIFPMAERDLSDFEKAEVIEKMAEIRNHAEVQPTPEIIRPSKTYRIFRMEKEMSFHKAMQTQLLAETDVVQIKTLAIKAGNMMTTHWSPKQIILVCMQGEAQWGTEGASASLKPGDGVLMDPRLTHSLEAKSDSLFLMILTSEPKNH